MLAAEHPIRQAARFVSLDSSLLASIGAGTVVLGTLIRLGWVIVGTVRSHRYRSHAEVYNRTWIQRINSFEPFILPSIALVLAVLHGPGETPAFWRTAGALAGAALALLALAISIWAIASFPRVATGHFVLSDHQVVDSGPYAYIRHPFYSGVFLLWVGLILAFPHWSVLAVFLLYVVPSYLNYIHAEERMLIDHFGEAYLAYQRRTGKLCPRLVAQPQRAA